ncbi:MAG TPA: cellulase family glycosylhydrolase [Capsulimonadaceae bacterium]|nr:cellulase family glycosylhydrolase [Capsulimonadaceae bacterium]
MKSIRLALILLLLLVLPLAPAFGQSFVEVSNGQFVLSGKPYRALGFTSYQYCVGAWNSQATRADIEKVFDAAKANGMNLFRCTDTIYDFSVGDLNKNLSDAVWDRIDMLLDIARVRHMKVILDLAGPAVRTAENASPPFDYSDPANFDRIKAIYSEIPNRVNSINGRKYRDDPTLFGYSILGEIVPYGLQHKPDGTVDLSDPSRDVENYEKLVHMAAVELRKNDPNHLICAGGLLHMSPDGPVKDASGKPYWQTLWSDPVFDYAAIHIYPDWDHILKGVSLPLAPPYPFSLPVGEWANLGVYKKYADSIHKPLMVEEWGLPLNRRVPDNPAGTLAYSPQFAVDYVNSAFKAVSENHIPIMIVWAWHPWDGHDAHFDLFPNETPEADALIAIIKRYGMGWYSDEGN